MSETVQDAIMRLLDEARGKSISPADVAIAIAGRDEKVWSRLMTPVRQAAIALTLEGRIVILRKGRIADPRDFKGVYRLALSESGDSSDSS